MKYVVVVLWILFPVLVSGQTEKAGRLDFDGAYYGNNLWNPGLKFGAEYIWKEKIREKEKKKRTKIKTNQFILGGDIGFFWDPRDYTALFTYYGLVYRHTNTKGFRYNFAISPAGYFRSFLPETYEVEGSQVDKVVLPGRSYYAPVLTLGLGRLRRNKEKKLKAWFLDLDVMFLVPYNAAMVPLLNVAYGYRFNL